MRLPGYFILAVLALTGLTGCEHVGVFEPFREVECIQRARISITEAIAVAQADGGKVLEADYRQDDEMGCLRGNPGQYDITLLQDGRIAALSVDAESGRAGPRSDQNVMNALLRAGNRFEGSPADMARMMPDMEIGMSQAIGTAQKDGGIALSAWIEAKDGEPGYTVKVVENGRVRVTWVAGT